MANIIFIIVLLHLAAGFGYLVYKLSPTKKTVEKIEADKISFQNKKETTINSNKTTI